MFVTISPTLCAKCADFGARVVANHKANSTTRANGASVKSGKDIYSDANFQAGARAGEVAACVALGIDPLTALNWDDQPDGGEDFKVGKWSVDVKTSTHQRAEYLIWPKTKMPLLGECADILMLVKITVLDHGEVEGEICGWQWSKMFRRDAKMARGIKSIVDGQPVMHKRDLRPVEDIISYFAA